jgi:hypothetical protein
MSYYLPDINNTKIINYLNNKTKLILKLKKNNNTINIKNINTNDNNNTIKQYKLPKIKNKNKKIFLLETINETNEYYKYTDTDTDKLLFNK